MKKKKIWIISLIILLAIGIGIGGKVYMDKKEIEKEQELLAVEKQSIRALKNTFADIAEVKVEKSVYDKVTGSYGMFVTMTNIHKESVYFTYTFWKESGENDGFGIENREVQKKGMTKVKIKVTYSNGSEEII